MSQALAVEKIRIWRDDPRIFVREVFQVTPDPWQDEVLADFPHNPFQALLACKGPGKTTVIAWLCWNFLVTRSFSKIGATSISGSNLSAGLWAEMAKWRRVSALITHLFEWTAKRIFCKEAPENWFMDFRTWQQSADEHSLGQTLAGLWADNVMNVIDEAGGVPVAVLKTAEVVAQKFGQANCDGHVLIAGNTTSTNGALYEACKRRAHIWKVYSITADPDDPKRTPRVDIEYARQQITEYGRDNPWVMINILGQFPRQGINTFVSHDEVLTAQRRHYPESVYAGSPMIMGVDVAAFGDDEFVFWFRQGLVSFAPLRMRNLDTAFAASHMLRVGQERKAASIQLDMGGYGAAIYNIATASMNATNVLGVHFGGKPNNPARFKNKRAEMLWDACEWIKNGGALPPVPEMVEGLATMTYSYTLTGQIQVEEKSQIKARIGRSPDPEDALMCSFAFPVQVPMRDHMGLPDSLASLIGRSQHVSSLNYNPLERFAKDLNHG